MPRSLVLPLVALIGAGCVTEPSTLAGAAGSPASGRAGSGGRDGGAAAGASGSSTGTGGFIDQGCGSRDFTLERLPPEILILLDASGSMNQDAAGVTCNNQGCGASSKWAETVAAINATVARTESTVSWGLKLFPDNGLACGYSNGVAVPVSPGNAAAIASVLAARTGADGGLLNGGNTPTRLAENAGVAYLNTRTTMNPRFILLATDGLPNCVPGQTDTAIDDSAGTVQAIQNASTAGYPTFVVGVGIGNPTADATLGQMAVAGGYPRPGSPTYYPVAGTAELDATLTTLVSIAASCTFALPPPPTNDGTTTRGRIGVRVDGTNIPMDAAQTNGWSYTDASMNSVQLFGPLCDAIMAGEVHTVSIVFYCYLG